MVIGKRKFKKGGNDLMANDTWSIKELVDGIVNRLKNRFDCLIIIEGNRGLGKSTLAIHLARRVAREFKKRGSSNYKFNWRHSFLYTKKETKNFLNRWRSIGIADELINVTFNRDFFDGDQKDIIKMLNMNRDHNNLFIACVPQFQSIDNQIKNLCAIRITVIKRGMAIIHTQNDTIFSKDKWDQATNERIEREWMKKGIVRPRFHKYTTYRGKLGYPALHPTAEEKYQNTKNEKRNIIAKEDMGIGEKEEEKNPYAEMIEMLKKGQVRNSIFVEGYAIAHGLKPTSFLSGLRRQLKAEGINSKLSSYYWDKKSKDGEGGFMERQRNNDQVEMLKQKINSV